MFVNKLVYAIYFGPISAVKGFRLYMLQLLESRSKVWPLFMETFTKFLS